MKNRALIYHLDASVNLATEVSRLADILLGESEVVTFADGEIIVENTTPVQNKNIYIIQSTYRPVSDHLFQLLVFVDGLKRANAKRITAIIPYFGYARQDRKTKPQEPITAKLVADMLTNAGVDQIIALDLHTAQVQGFFDCPVIELIPTKLFATYYKKYGLKDNLVIVSPDHGGVTRARLLAREFEHASVAIIDKHRDEYNRIDTMRLIGDVRDKSVIIVDDIIDSGVTLVKASDLLLKHGAKDVYVAASHGVFSSHAVESLAQSQIKKIIITDSIPFTMKSTLIDVVSIAPMLAQTIAGLEQDFND